uniref:Uncharacterized protein n=1 Tax=Faecalibaculum rodentium TaxID=1702221 RepID=A0A140DWM0_9FIRM|nr:hypothetical protein AALO17_19130 [Faecalibaculum rodentium]
MAVIRYNVGMKQRVTNFFSPKDRAAGSRSRTHAKESRS